MINSPSPMLATLIALAEDAGRVIMAIYNGPIASRTKDDNSPVTLADEKAEATILAGLRAHFPDIPVVAEEAVAAGQKPTAAARFFLVDPLDGTKEFISRNGEFTVNIALVENGIARMGVVYAPAISALYWGELGKGAFKRGAHGEAISIKTRHVPRHGMTVLASRSHLDDETKDFLAMQHVCETMQSGSSLKFCRVAEGAADLYPRFGRTMEWDTASGQAVLEAAGGKVVDREGAPLRYGKIERGFDNPGFIASGR
jgi:3'(2'), 5'-bisphosphate nucleotidase